LFGEIALELQDIADVGPRQEYNRLIVVAHDADVARLAPKVW